MRFFFFEFFFDFVFFFDTETKKTHFFFFFLFPSTTSTQNNSPDTYYGEEVSVLEMDGAFDKLEELIYVESHLSQTSSKFYGEITQQMLKNSSFPGSTNGTGLFQTICGLKIREVYEKIVKKEVASVSA